MQSLTRIGSVFFCCIFAQLVKADKNPQVFDICGFFTSTVKNMIKDVYKQWI